MIETVKIRKAGYSVRMSYEVRVCMSWVLHIVCDDVMKVVRKRKNVMEKLTDVETAVHSFIPS